MRSSLSVRFYASPTGSEPVREWLLTLDRGARRAIGTDIKTVELGWPLGMPLVRKMQSQLWEIRCHLTGSIARVLFTVAGKDLVLLHGFIKKAQKTPAADLQVAVRRMKEVHDGQ